jgi:hypothetical protein
VEAARLEAQGVAAEAPALADAHLARWLAGRERYLEA